MYTASKYNYAILSDEFPIFTLTASVIHFLVANITVFLYLIRLQEFSTFKYPMIPKDVIFHFEKISHLYVVLPNAIFEYGSKQGVLIYNC